MTTVVAIYTGHGLADPLKALINEHLPDVRLYNILDDSLIQHTTTDRRSACSTVRRARFEIAGG